MSYKTCPSSVTDIKENIKICKELVSGLEKREKDITAEIAKNPDQEPSKLIDELSKIHEQISQWNNRCSENLDHLNAVSKMKEASNA